MILQPVMSVEEIVAFWREHFPQVADDSAFTLVSVAPGEAMMRLQPGERHLRPGGTVSGPALFALADVAAYAALLAHAGPRPLMVTTSMNVNFLRRPPPTPLLARCRMLKLGRRLAVLEIGIAPDAGADLVAHATATYSIPPAEV